jgi:hypothetical protein
MGPAEVFGLIVLAVYLAVLAWMIVVMHLSLKEEHDGSPIHTPEPGRDCCRYGSCPAGGQSFRSVDARDAGRR